MQLPGWDSLADVARYEVLWTRWIAWSVVFIGAGLTITCGIIGSKYKDRKEELQRHKQAAERAAATQELQKKLAAAIPAPVEMGTLALDVREMYTGNALSGVTCTLNNGLVIKPPQAIDHPVGKFSGNCILPGYFDTVVIGEVSKSKAPVTVHMEKKTGTLNVTVVGENGKVVEIGGRHIALDDEFRDFWEVNTHELRARKLAKVTFRGNQEFAGATTKVMVKGGTTTLVTLRVPVLGKDDKQRE
jgi:hypothetical protein